MKITKFLLLVLLVSVISLTLVNAKDNAKIPSINIKDLKGGVINTSTLGNDGKPFIINFWATWCMPCIEEMKAFSENYEEWQNTTGVKIISISIDDSRNSKKVAPFVKGRNWKFEVYIDENQEFRRAMNVNHPPHSFICNGKGEVVWQHAGFAPGDEETLYDELKKILADGEKIDNDYRKPEAPLKFK